MKLYNSLLIFKAFLLIKKVFNEEKEKKDRRHRIAADREAVRAGRGRSEENGCEGKKQER